MIKLLKMDAQKAEQMAINFFGYCDTTVNAKVTFQDNTWKVSIFLESSENPVMEVLIDHTTGRIAGFTRKSNHET